MWVWVLWQSILDGRGLTSQNVNGTETREVRCRRKKGKAIIAVECGARAARHRRTSSASSFRPPWLKVDIERRGVAPGTALAIFDPATYRAGDRPRQKLAVLIAWMCRTICKCAEYEPSCTTANWRRVFTPPVQLTRECSDYVNVYPLKHSCWSKFKRVTESLSESNIFKIIFLLENYTLPYNVTLIIVNIIKSINKFNSVSNDPNEDVVDTAAATATECHSNWVNAYRQKVRRQISDISRRPAAARPS